MNDTNMFLNILGTLWNSTVGPALDPYLTTDLFNFFGITTSTLGIAQFMFMLTIGGLIGLAVTVVMKIISPFIQLIFGGAIAGLIVLVLISYFI